VYRLDENDFGRVFGLGLLVSRRSASRSAARSSDCSWALICRCTANQASVAAISVMAPATTFPANPIQSDDFIVSPVEIAAGIITMITQPSAIASDISHNGLSPARLFLFIRTTCRAIPLFVEPGRVGFSAPHPDVSRRRECVPRRAICEYDPNYLYLRIRLELAAPLNIGRDVPEGVL
jgi:hypothetical protein